MTLKAVAEAARVSVKTASRALSGTGYVRAETRSEVMRAATQLGYVPNRAARAMRSGDAGIVGLLAHLVTTSPFTTELMRAVERVVEASGRALLIADGAAGRAATGRARRLFQEFQADPVIFAASYHQSAEGLFDPDGGRAILVNCVLPGSSLPAFVPDDEGGGYAQARHVLEMGHRRIGLIELPPGLIARDLRRRGAERAFAEAGVRLDPTLVRTGQDGPPEARRTVAFEAALDLLSRPDRPTAILCSKDEFALQVVGAAARLGLQVPEDLSVVGFDDAPVLAATMRPALTTVRLPYFEMGRRAALLAVGGEDPGPGIHRVECPLVPRDSARAL